MKQDINKLFKNLSEKNPPSFLEGAILNSIKEERRKQVKRNILFSYLGISLSVLIFFYATFLTGESILKSEFWNLSSLFFSDIAIISQYWKDFIFSLLETFPFANFIFILIPIFFLFILLNFTISIREKYRHIVSH
jgi:hypothetical protein